MKPRASDGDQQKTINKQYLTRGQGEVAGGDVVEGGLLEGADEVLAPEGLVQGVGLHQVVRGRDAALVRPAGGVSVPEITTT